MLNVPRETMYDRPWQMARRQAVHKKCSCHESYTPPPTLAGPHGGIFEYVVARDQGMDTPGGGMITASALTRIASMPAARRDAINARVFAKLSRLNQRVPPRPQPPPLSAEDLKMQSQLDATLGTRSFGMRQVDGMRNVGTRISDHAGALADMQTRARAARTRDVRPQVGVDDAADSSRRSLMGVLQTLNAARDNDLTQRARHRALMAKHRPGSIQPTAPVAARGGDTLAGAVPVGDTLGGSTLAGPRPGTSFVAPARPAPAADDAPTLAGPTRTPALPAMSSPSPLPARPAITALRRPLPAPALSARPALGSTFAKFLPWRRAA